VKPTNNSSFLGVFIVLLESDWGAIALGLGEWWLSHECFAYDAELIKGEGGYGTGSLNNSGRILLAISVKAT